MISNMLSLVKFSITDLFLLITMIIYMTSEYVKTILHDMRPYFTAEMLPTRKLLISADLLSVVGIVVSKEIGVLNLKQGLEEFFIKNTDGVLELSKMSIAIWKEEDYFYLFDSRACDNHGLHLIEESSGKNGKEPEPATKKVIGKSCVMRFLSLNALYDHFLKNLDPTKSSDRFIISRIEVLNDIPGIRDWNFFKPAVEGISWILQGRINSNSPTFKNHSRGIQGLAMPVIALVSNTISAPSNWTKEDIDDITKEADAYFHWCIPPPPEDAEEPPEQKYLILKRLKRTLYFKNRKVIIEVKDSRIIGNLMAAEDSNFLNLMQALKSFFEKYQYGIIETNDKYFAIWKFEEELKDKSKELAYYLYNDRPKDGFFKHCHPDSSKKDAPACILRFLNLNKIAPILQDELLSEAETSLNDFFVHEIIVASVSEPLSDLEIEKDKEIPLKPELRSYSAAGETGASLAGNFSQGNEALFKIDTRDKQQAGNALATLAMTKLFDPHLWTSEVLDDILKKGDKLTQENMHHLGEFESEESEVIRDYLLPHEFEHELYLGVNEMALDVEEEAAEAKFPELVKTLEEFFKTSKMGIFRFLETLIAIWKEEEVFFAMNPRGKEGGVASVYWNIDLETFAEYLTSCVEDLSGDFIIDGVAIENKYTETEKPDEQVEPVENMWFNFSKVSEGVWKIDFSEPAVEENKVNRIVDVEDNKEDKEEEVEVNSTAAICIMAIIFSKVYESRHWSSEVVDEVIITGKKLHACSVIRWGDNKTFRPSEIITEFFLSNRRIDLSIQDCAYSGTLNSENSNTQNLAISIFKFFDEFSTGCLTLCNTKNLAIWKCDDGFYCFHPKFSLMRFESITLLIDQLLTLAENDDNFEITKVNIVDWNKLPPWKFDPSPAVRPSNLPSLNAYYRLPGKARAILRGYIHQESEIFAESIRGHQTAANCIVCLAMSVIKNPVTWSRKILDEILAIGVQLHRESLKTCNKITTLKPKDIMRVFHIGVNVMAADVEEATISGIVANPPPEPEDDKKKKGKKKAPKKKGGGKGKKGGPTRVPPPPPPLILLEDGLNKFFENNNAGILVTGRFMIAIWKDSGVYFVYDPRPRNMEGLKESNCTECSSCVVWFACKEPLFDLILANINDDEKYAKFEICKVILRTVPIEPLPAPAGYRTFNESVPSPPNDCDCPKPPILPEEFGQIQAKEELMVDLESSFTRIDKDLSILLGKSHLLERRFPAQNRGFQSTAVAAVTIVVASLHAPSTWTTSLIDAVLKYGDILHTECARLSRPGSRNLSVSELLEVFVVGDVRARIRIHRNLTAGISLEEDMFNALKLFFAKNVFGILHTIEYAIGIMEHWGKFYFLDPSEKNRFKKDSFEGAACLIKCENLTKLTKVILQVCAFKDPTVYTLSAVQILDLHFFTR